MLGEKYKKKIWWAVITVEMYQNYQPATGLYRALHMKDRINDYEAWPSLLLFSTLCYLNKDTLYLGLLH